MITPTDKFLLKPKGQSVCQPKVLEPLEFIRSNAACKQGNGFLKTALPSTPKPELSSWCYHL